MDTVINLPKPKLKGELSVEEAIQSRRSNRDFKSTSLTIEQLSQLLWSAQGTTGHSWGGLRASPSAGATYPLELYAVIGKVEGIEPGVYHYLNESHSLRCTLVGDIRPALASAALGQGFILEAPLSIVIIADYRRTTRRYGERGKRYVHMEIGHVGQNLYLEAVSLGLGTCAVGAFHDEEVDKVLGLPKDLESLYIMPFGHIR